MRYPIQGKFLIAGLSFLIFASGCVDHNYRPEEFVESIAFSPDSNLIAIGYRNLTLKEVEVKTGKTVQEFKGRYPEEPDRLTELVYSPDGKTLACGFAGRFGDAINTWDAATGQMQRYIPHAAQSIAFSPDGQLLAGGGAEWRNQKWTVATMFWNAQSGKLERTLRQPTEGNIRSLSLSPSGKTVVTANDIEDPKAQMLTDVAVVSAWNIATGKILWSAKEPTTFTPFVAFSPDGQFVASISSDTVKLRDAKTGKAIRTLKIWTNTLAFSPDGATLAVGTGNDVTLWKVQTGTQLNVLKDHVGSITDLKYSPDGKLLASGSEDHTVDLWDTHTGVLVQSFGKKHEYRPNPFS